jgi:hypothetical protein
MPETPPYTAICTEILFSFGWQFAAFVIQIFNQYTVPLQTTPNGRSDRYASSLLITEYHARAIGHAPHQYGVYDYSGLIYS